MSVNERAIRNPQRVELVTQAIAKAERDVFVCGLPLNVLMISGYWPVVGTSIVRGVEVLTPFQDSPADLIVR